MTGITTDFKKETGDKKAGKVMLICSAVGGSGKTTVTVNLAALLAERNLKTAVVDGDLQFGDIALALNLIPVTTVKEAVEQNGLKEINDYCLMHKSGLRLLAAPTRPEYADLITADALVLAVEGMREQSDIVLVETQHGLTDQNIILMDQADSIMVVTTPGMAALKNTKLMFETLVSLGLEKKVSLIVNKSDAPTIMDVSDISRFMGNERVALLPSCPKRIARSMDTGIPLTVSNPRHRFSKQMKKLADQYFSAQSTNDKKAKRRIMPKFSINKQSNMV